MNLAAYVVGVVRAMSADEIASIRSMGQTEVRLILQAATGAPIEEIDASLSAYGNTKI